MNYGLNVKKSQLFETDNPEMALPVILKKSWWGWFFFKIFGPKNSFFNSISTPLPILVFQWTKIICMYSWLEVIFATWTKAIFNSSEVVFSHPCKIPVFYCEKYRYSSHLWKIPVFSLVKVIFLLWRCKIPVFSFAKVVFLL